MFYIDLQNIIVFVYIIINNLHLNILIRYCDCFSVYSEACIYHRFNEFKCNNYKLVVNSYNIL